MANIINLDRDPNLSFTDSTTIATDDVTDSDDNDKPVGELMYLP